MSNEAYITEAKERIKRSILKDELLIFFSRVLEDLKSEVDPNLFGRVKDIYILVRPYADYYDHEIYSFFSSHFVCDEGMSLDDEEIHYLKIFFKELKKDFHLKNPKIMKGRIKGILTKLCEKYFPESYKIIEPNLLIRLVSAVGGVERLKNMPASTIQLIGAEQALFRHVSSGKKSPKYGLLYYSKFLQKEKNKGKAARQLANKLAISIKIDYFRNVNPR